jgi:hypothetical protein
MGGWILTVSLAEEESAGRTEILDCLLDGFAGFARFFLDATEEFLLLAFGKLEIVVRERGPFLFQLAFGDVPIAFDFKCGHKFNRYSGRLVWSAAGVTAGMFVELAEHQNDDDDE